MALTEEQANEFVGKRVRVSHRGGTYSATVTSVSGGKVHFVDGAFDYAIPLGQVLEVVVELPGKCSRGVCNE